MSAHQLGFSWFRPGLAERLLRLRWLRAALCFVEGRWIGWGTSAHCLLFSWGQQAVQGRFLSQWWYKRVNWSIRSIVSGLVSCPFLPKSKSHSHAKNQGAGKDTLFMMNVVVVWILGWRVRTSESVCNTRLDK